MRQVDIVCRVEVSVLDHSTGAEVDRLEVTQGRQGVEVDSLIPEAQQHLSQIANRLGYGGTQVCKS